MNSKRKSTLTQKRRAEALRLRARGWTLTMIGDKFGVTKQAVYGWIGRSKRFETYRADQRD